MLRAVPPSGRPRHRDRPRDPTGPGQPRRSPTLLSRARTSPCARPPWRAARAGCARSAAARGSARTRRGPARCARRSSATAATRQGDEPVVRGTYRALGADALHPNACQLTPTGSSATGERWNARGHPLQYVPPPFDDERAHRLDAGVVADRTAGTGCCPPPCCTTARDEPAPDAPAAPTPTATRPAAARRTRWCRASWSWSSGTRWPCGGTTARRSRPLDLDAFDEPYIDRLRDGYRRVHGASVGAGPHLGLRHPGGGGALARAPTSRPRTSSSASARTSTRAWRCAAR